MLRGVKSDKDEQPLNRNSAFSRLPVSQDCKLEISFSERQSPNISDMSVTLETSHLSMPLSVCRRKPHPLNVPSKFFMPAVLKHLRPSIDESDLAP